MADSKVNVLIFGIGGIGGVYAAILALSGKANVHVVARSNYDDLVGNGMKLRSEKFGEKNLKFDGVWKSCEDAKRSGTDFDYVICATKALLDSKPSLSDNIAPVISTKTSVVLLQNGVGAEEPLHASFPSTTIISAVVWTGGRTKPSEGGQVVIEQFNAEGLTIGVDYRQGGDAVEEDSKLDRLVKVLEAGGGSVTVTKDIQSERWVKVIWNCCWNSITAITSLRTNPFFQSSEQALPLCRTIMREVEAVAKAKGLTVPADTVDVLIKRCTDVGGAGLPSSMMADNLAGRPMEVEVILGTPVREAARLGVNAPTLTALYVILKALDYGNIQGFREQRS